MGSSTQVLGLHFEWKNCSYTQIYYFASRLYQERILEDLDEENITYRRMDYFEFDPIASYPNTEDDVVTIVNAPYHVSAQGLTLPYCINTSHCWALNLSATDEWCFRKNSDLVYRKLKRIPQKYILSSWHFYKRNKIYLQI